MADLNNPLLYKPFSQYKYDQFGYELYELLGYVNCWREEISYRYNEKFTNWLKTKLNEIRDKGLHFTNIKIISNATLYQYTTTVNIEVYNTQDESYSTQSYPYNDLIY